MRRDHRRKLKFLDANYPIGTTQCLARATTDLHPEGAFLVGLFCVIGASRIRRKFK